MKKLLFLSCLLAVPLFASGNVSITQSGASGGSISIISAFDANSFIANSSSLQSGAVMNISSGTVLYINVSSVVFANGSIMTQMPSRYFWWPAHASYPLEAAADSFASPSIETGTNVDMAVEDFDSATDECRTITFGVPDEINTSSGASVSVYWMSTSTNVGAAIFDIRQNSGIGVGGNPDSTLTTSALGTVTTSTTTSRLNKTEAFISFSTLGWASGEMVHALICRDADNASDTMSGDARVFAYRIKIPQR